MKNNVETKVTKVQEFGLKAVPLIHELYTEIYDYTTELNVILDDIVKTMFELPKQLINDEYVNQITYYLGITVDGWFTDFDSLVSNFNAHDEDDVEFINKVLNTFDKFWDLLGDDMTEDKSELHLLQRIYKN